MYVNYANYEKKVWTVMVINSTNIKKMNNQRITLILAELTEHIETTTLKIQVLAMDKHKNLAGSNR